MLIAPYHTDAPVYHLPIATVSIIVVNVVVFFLTTFQMMLGNIELDSIRWLMLEFDQVNPLQWITGAFMHADPIHLIGNMIFLWSFGLVVEGKLGSPKFTLLYFIITLLDGAFGQIPMFLLGGEEFALGASGVIFALMVIACIWAPENEMDCFYWIFIYVGTFEIRIVKLGGIYIFLQLVSLWLGGFSMSSAMLHMIGVVIGAPIGFYMLRQDMVDCEGWDLVSRNEFLQDNDLLCTEKQRERLRRKRQSIEDPVTAALGYTQPLPTKGPGGPNVRPNAGPEAAPPAPADPPKTKKRLSKLTGMFEPERVKRQRREQENASPPSVTSHPEFNRLAFMFRQAVESASTTAATQTFLRMDQMKLSAGLADATLLRYVSLLGREKRWVEALRPLTLIAVHEGDAADDARLRIAQIQLKVLVKPTLALQTLNQIADPAVPTDADRKRQETKTRLIEAAKRAIAR